MMHVATTTRADLGLLVIRLAAGVTFAAHGAQKVFVSGVSAVTEGFAGMGLSMAASSSCSCWRRVPRGISLAGPGRFSVDRWGA